jgi:iron complex outermembrane receptor protein
MKRAGKWILGALGFCSITSVTAQTSIDIDEVEISAARSKVEFNQAARNVTVISREDIERSPARNLNELLEYISGSVDVRQRGPAGIQADVSIRGASFEQVLILLNGIKMTDPQTGHHAMNLPISLMDIERIEVLHGGAARIYGPGAFAGSINIITRTPEVNKGKAEVAAGQYGMRQLGVSASVVEEKHNHTVSWQQQQADGFIRNTDYNLENVFWQSELTLNKSDWRLNFGRNKKAFGAQSFYTARFPDQYEETQTEFASIAGEIKQGALIIEPRAYARRHNDRFELFREEEGYYYRLSQGGFANRMGDTISWYNGHNYHRTDVYGAEINLSYKSKWGVSSLGLDYRREEILSNVLGQTLESRKAVKNEDATAFYLKGEDRENKSIYAEHNFSNDKYFVSLGAMLNIHSKYDTKLYPGIDASYQLTDELRPYASVNRSFRFPSYTDLYYSLGGAIGSADLKPEESMNYEVGVKYRGKKDYGQVAAFRREGDNLIDWIRYNGSAITQASNLTDITISGLEATYVIKAPDLEFVDQLRLNYSYLYSESNSDGFESNYVLDFLKHKLDAMVRFSLVENLLLDWNLSYQDRKGEFVNVDGEENSFEGIFLSDLKLTAKGEKASVFVQVSNVFNQQYFDIGNVKTPGRWITAGLSYHFNFSPQK